MTLKEFIKKMEKVHDLNEHMTHIKDWLESEEAPKRISERMTFEQALVHADNWTKKINKRNANKLTSGEVEVVMSFDNGINIVKLLNENAYHWEGNKMGHCVASYYTKKNHGTIYSLRDKNYEPHCTIEVKENKVIQLQGKCNKEVVEKYHNYIFDFIKQFEYKIEDNCLNKIGYLHLTKDDKNILCEDALFEKQIGNKLYVNVNKSSVVFIKFGILSYSVLQFILLKKLYYLFEFIFEKYNPGKDMDEKQKILYDILKDSELKMDFDKYSNSIFWLDKEGCWLMELNIKNGQIWIQDSRVWSIFESRFLMNYQEIKAFFKYQVEEHFKLKGVTPCNTQCIRNRLVEEHFKLKGVTPSINISSIDGFKLKGVTPMFKRYIYS